MKRLNSLRRRLFLWYVTSLILLGVFIILVIHVFAIKNGVAFIILLFLTLALFGFTMIYKITQSLTYLAFRMRTISSKNLNERVELKSDDEIGGLAETFNDLLERLHEAFKREQRFIADVAHELKTPLTTLRSALEVSLQQERTTEEYQKTLREGLNEINEIASTLKNVLDLAWSETPLERHHAHPFNLSIVMEDLSDTAQKMARNKDISVASALDKEIIVLGFEGKLGRALLNIIDNAVKYTPPRGRIELFLKKENDRTVVKIRDTGSGISKQDLPHIFDRFYRGSSTEKVIGSGLGLAITKAIVASHQGEITVKSIMGRGSTFTISLPLA